MRNVFKRWWQWISAIDTALSWAGRAWMGYLLLTSTGAGVLLGTIAWLAQNFVYGVWAFLGTWVLITAAQAFRVVKHSGGAPPERSAESKAEDSTRQSPQLSEADRTELQRLRGKVESLTELRDKLQEEVNSRDADRDMYWSLLVAALKEGLELRESNPSREDAQEWASRLHKLLEDAEGEWRVKPFRRPTPGYAYADLDATGEQAFMDYRLSRLQDLIQLVQSRQSTKFRSGFDPHEWKDWKSPPQNTSALQGAAQQRPGYWDNRQMLHAALKDFCAEGAYLDNEDIYDDDEVKQWESRTTQLIAESLGQERVNDFLTNDDRISRREPDDSPRQAWVKYRIAQLGILIQVVDSLSSLEIRPDFDGRKWVGSEQFRFKQGTGF